MYFPTYSHRSDPFALMRSMLRDFDTFDPSRTRQPVFPAVNIWQGDDAVAITAELPGVDSSDLEVSVNDNVLTISGRRTAPDAEVEAVWHRRERTHGEFSRSIRLPFEAEDDKVEARLQNGVLRVVVGMPEAQKPRRIAIKAA